MCFTSLYIKVVLTSQVTINEMNKIIISLYRRWYLLVPTKNSLYLSRITIVKFTNCRIS